MELKKQYKVSLECLSICVVACTVPPNAAQQCRAAQPRMQANEVRQVEAATVANNALDGLLKGMNLHTAPAVLPVPGRGAQHWRAGGGRPRRV